MYQAPWLVQTQRGVPKHPAAEYLNGLINPSTDYPTYALYHAAVEGPGASFGNTQSHPPSQSTVWIKA